jgi:hypothetical protein
MEISTEETKSQTPIAYRSTLSTEERDNAFAIIADAAPNASRSVHRDALSRTRVPANEQNGAPVMLWGDTFLTLADGAKMLAKKAREEEQSILSRSSSQVQPLEDVRRQRWQSMPASARSLYLLADRTTDPAEKALINRLARALENTAPVTAEIPEGVK